jgi:hypothetical protein
MLKRLIPTILMFGLLIAGLSVSVFAQDVHEASFVSQGEIQLTVSRTGEAFVTDTRRFALEEGLNLLTFSNVPRNFDQNTVVLSFPSEGYYLSQQRFQDETQTNRASLLLASIGQNIRLIRNDATELTAILLQVNGDELLLQLENGQIMSAFAPDYRQIIYPETLELVTPSPGLQLWVYSPGAGEADLSLSYLTYGFYWNMQYTMLLKADESITLNAWLVLQNNVGINFEDIALTLISGETSQVQFVAAQTEFMAVPTATPLYSATQMSQNEIPSANAGGGGFIADTIYQEYRLPENLSIASDEILHLEFLAGASLSTEKRFVYDASPRIFGYSGFITNPSYGLSDIRSVQDFLEVKANRDLPSGDLKIFQATDTGAQRLIGQSLINYTPANTALRVYLANSEEVTGERVQVSVQQASDNAIQETFEIRLRNTSDATVLITVPERMSRSATWEILSSTAPFEQPDAFGIVYEVEIPAGESLTISYTVLYTR